MTLRWFVILAIALVAFFASYRYAVAASGSSQPAASGVASSPGGQVTSVSGGGGCCGGGGSTAAASAAPVAPAASASPVDPSAAAPVAATGGGGCCGGASGPAITKAAEVVGDVQKINVDLSTGSYDPSVIELKAGVPAEITFGQSAGCTGQVQSQELGFAEDLTSGPKTVKLGALTAGTYSFACGMNMVTGTIVVK